MNTRLDKLLVKRGIAESRAKAQALIMAGEVMVGGRVITKAGHGVSTDAVIEVKRPFPYVSRSALKLKAGLDYFSLDISDKVAIDIGASTGGFTEVLLEYGARRVYAVDVGHGQLHWKLRNDKRVINLEGINARYLERDMIPERCDVATLDVSFISLRLLVGKVKGVLKDRAAILALVKPQFEAERKDVTRGGLVRDDSVTIRVLSDMEVFFRDEGMDVIGIIPAPIKGLKGNQEYLLHALYRQGS